MCKQPEEMTAAELGMLYPILLSKHEPAWQQRYQEEQERLAHALGGQIVRIHHIGSTSVPGLLAKPTIDILLEVRTDVDCNALVDTIKNLGYRFSPQPKNPAPHMMFMKGYTPHGFEGQAFHLHVRYPGDWDELYFRDYLCTHPEAARDYEELKLLLKRRHEHDREAYTNGKTEFIQYFTRLARELYGGRYAVRPLHARV